MGGSVHALDAAEWVADWYDPKYYATASDKNPKGPEKGTQGASVAAAGSTARRVRGPRGATGPIQTPTCTGWVSAVRGM